MNDLLHRVAARTKPIWSALLAAICVRHVVQADETRMRMLDDGMGKPKHGFMWTFVAADEHGDRDVALVFAGDRSDETPSTLLDKTTSSLLVDGYSGYNDVASVSSRVRAGCHAHLRRYFHDALATAPIAQEAIDLIGAIYGVEQEAAKRSLIGNSKLEFGKLKAGPIRDRLRAWLETQRKAQLPKSPIGAAIKYGLNSWDALGRFLEDARVPLDNNASEAALRRVALGRKNYLFVGDVDSGRNIAGLYTLIATCEARGINPFASLT